MFKFSAVVIPACRESFFIKDAGPLPDRQASRHYVIEMPIAYIGIGSNLGNREENCLKAVRLLAGRGVAIKKQSLMRETEPWGVKDQSRFINMAIEVETECDPERLLEILKTVEEEIGRKETYKWGPRLIDLDILLYNDFVINTPDLRIPHPHMHERGFVLIPLAEIAPDKIHPTLKKTIKELLSEIEK